ncbi:uncharacterized protein LOC144104023 isoform X1 [Amblyomma americanum]
MHESSDLARSRLPVVLVRQHDQTSFTATKSVPVTSWLPRLQRMTACGGLLTSWGCTVIEVDALHKTGCKCGDAAGQLRQCALPRGRRRRRRSLNMPSSH